MSLKDIALLKPDFTINCKFAKAPKDIYGIMREMGITKSYAYGILHQPTLLSFKFLKVGMSSPELNDREHQVGERLVRQLSWAPGWQCENPKTSNGYDFWMNVQNDLISKNMLPKNFDKNNLIVAVWNVSKRMGNSDFILEQERTAAAWAEGSLASQHKEIYGSLPPLNYADPSTTKSFTQPHINRTVFDALFG
jgi:hypothetical protein